MNSDPVTRPERLLSYCKREWKVLLLVTVFGTVFNGLMPLIAIMQGRLIDDVIGGIGTVDLIRQIAVFLSLVVFIQVSRYFKRYFVRVFSNRTSASMRRSLYNSIMSRDLSAVSRESTGDLMNRAVSDVDICTEGVRKVITEIFDTGVLMASYLVSMLFYDIPLTLAACIFIPVAMLLAEHLKVRITSYNKQARAQSSVVTQSSFDNVEHAVLYRINGVFDIRNAEYSEQLMEFEKRNVKASILENSMQPVYNMISMLGILAIIIMGGEKTVEGSWTVGMFSAYVIIFTALAVKASKAAKLFNSYQKAVVSWERIRPLMSPYHRYEEAAPETGPAHLEVRRLDFRYPSSDTQVFKGVSLESRSGDIVCITGKIASGKTALGLAVAGIHPYGGSVKLNGTEVSTADEQWRGANISYMGHSLQLLSGSIYENITLGRDGDISRVLSDVCFETDLESMPDGVNTVIGTKGVRLSGGQQARIALARTLYQGGELVILDDPFSSVDRITEKRMFDNIRSGYPDRIFLIISHRMMMFPSSDKVVFMTSGENAIFGTHQELMCSVDEYREMYIKQTGVSNDRP